MTAERPSAKGDFLFSLDPAGSLSLQNQIRRRIISAISAGVFPSGWRLPSSRRLARELSVARNTVTLAYQELIAEGHLQSSERSGVFVADSMNPRQMNLLGLVGDGEICDAPELAKKIKQQIPEAEPFRCPLDWQRYRYPFVEGRFDRSLFPITDWREASRLALSVNDVADWSNDAGEIDDPKLIEQIRAQILPRRGIFAASNEILVVGSEQQALHLLAIVLMDSQTRIAVEEPGLPSTRSVLSLSGAQLHLQPVDDQGILIDKRLNKQNFIYVTPSRQRPTGVTMSMRRREELLGLANQRDMIVIEDDFDHESTFIGRPCVALRGMQGGSRVLYLASFSKALAPGVQLGFICGPANIISAARVARDLATHRPAPNTQRAASHFIALGHYEAMNVRLLRIVEERMLALRDALNHYLPQSIAHALPQSVAIAPIGGGSTVWVRGPDGLDARDLASELGRQGVLIEPAADYYGGTDKPINMFRMSVTSLPLERIRPGVELIASVIRQMTRAVDATASGLPLRGANLVRTLTGATLLYRTVYGEPCTIDLLPGGQLHGLAGSGNEESDSGTWRIEGDRWYRRWDNWAYAEETGFCITRDGDQLFLHNDDGRWVDSVVIVPSDARQESIRANGHIQQPLHTRS